MKKIFVMLACSVLTLLGCSSSKSSASASDNTVSVDMLNGKAYILDNMFDSNDVTISFDGESFNGKSVINHFFGTYKIENGNKFIANDSEVSTGMTMMAGAPDDMENDQKFIELFIDIDTIALDGNTLTFTTKGGETLVFVESDAVASIDATAFPETEGEAVADLGVANNVLALIGKEFKLSNMFDGNEITLVLMEGNKVAGKAAVNNYMGSYTTGDDNGFVISETMGTTRMAGEPSAMDAEAAYLALLPTVVSISFDDEALVLYTQDGTELIFQ